MRKLLSLRDAGLVDNTMSMAQSYRKEYALGDTLNQFFEQQTDRVHMYREFTEQYEHDAAHVTSGDVIRLYSELAHSLTEQAMDAAHEQAFASMSEEDRRGLAREYQYAGRDPTRSFQGYPNGMDFHQMMQPRRLGRMTRTAVLEDRELVDELLGPDSPLAGSGVKDAMATTTVLLVTRHVHKK